VSGPEVDLGGCGGCGLGCALTCDASPRVGQARQVLAATGVALLVLGVVPGLVVGGWTLLPAALTALAGLLIAACGVHAARSEGSGAQASARVGFRVVPVGVLALGLTWLVAVPLAFFV
jgi:hypothetical protein